MNFLSSLFGKKEQHATVSHRIPQQKRSTSVKNYSYGNYAGGFSGSKSKKGLSADGQPLVINSRKMVLNARRAMWDSLEARSIVDRNADIVTDTGIKINPTINASILGLSADQADSFNESIRDRFDLFMSSKTAHRARKFTGYDMQRLYNKALITDNDCYVRFYFEKEADALSTVSFDFVDTLSIVGDGATSTASNLTSREGIRYDSRGRETAYFVQRVTQDGTVESVWVPAKVNGRTIMTHGYIADLITQVKGISGLGHALDEFQKFTDFTQANIQKAIQHASMAFAVENTGDNDPSDPFEGLMGEAGMTPSALIPDSKTGDNLTDTEDTLTINRIPDFVTGANGSLAIVNLRAKDTIKMLDSKSPPVGYDKFTSAFMANLAASARMPLEVLQMKFNSNYSASRAALLLFYRVAQIYRQKIDAEFLSPLYENWLAEEIASGRIQCHGWSDPIIRAAWCSHSLIAAPVPNIDPLKNILSKEKELELSVVSHDQATFETNGSSGKANIASNRRTFPIMPIPFFSKQGNVTQNQAAVAKKQRDATILAYATRD